MLAISAALAAGSSLGGGGPELASAFKIIPGLLAVLMVVLVEERLAPITARRQEVKWRSEW